MTDGSASLLVDAVEASHRLGVTRNTLYAYVSRGLLRALPSASPSDRTSRYLLADVQRLAGERKRGRRPKEVVRAALNWGVPVLESGITLIHEDGMHYRGVSAVELGKRATLEQVAALLWSADEQRAFPEHAPEPGPLWLSALAHYSSRPIEDRILPLFVAASDGIDTGAWSQAPELAAEGCGVLLRLLAASMLGATPASLSVHKQCSKAWELNDADAELIRMALILCADHEFNTSSFTVRCVSSAQSTVRLAIIAGLAALAGVRHGGGLARVEALFDELEGCGDPRPFLRRRLARGETLPGFGHPLYPRGDFRARELFAQLPRATDLWWTVTDAARELTGEEPTLDFALVALCRHLHLCTGAAFGIFALGRTAGWIAHALEQRERVEMIRPRAIYVGPSPRESEPPVPRRPIHGRKR